MFGDGEEAGDAGEKPDPRTARVQSKRPIWWPQEAE